MWSAVWQILLNIWTLSLEAAPWILVGLVVAGLVKAWIPEQRVASWLGGGGLWTVTKAACIGAPLPLCSCGVIPAALGLRRSGASRSSATAFLIATPETGADSVGASYALLGPLFAVLRPVSAVVSGIVTGMLSGLAPEQAHKAAKREEPAGCGDCCDESKSSCSTEIRSRGCSGDDCCKSTVAVDDVRSGHTRSFWSRTGSGLHYAITEVLDDFSVWLAIGLTVAGVAITFIPPAALASYAGGPLAMLAMLIISVPVYVCATESTPIAAAMLVAGVSPGAVLVFLLAGPATNLGTVGALSREFGWRYVAIYLAGIAACALGFGLLANALVGGLGIDVTGQLRASRELVPDWLSTLSLLMLIVLAVPPLRWPLLRQLKARGAAVRDW